MFNICYVFYNFRCVLFCWGRYKIIQSLCAFKTRPLLFWKEIQTVMTTSQVFVIYSSLFSVMQAFFQKYHNTLCCPFKILHKHCFQFLLGLTITPREIANNAYAKFWRDDKGTIIVFFKKSLLYLVEDKVFVLEFYITYIHTISIY